MDNRQFNVKGRTKEQLQKAIECYMLDEYGKTTNIWGWKFHKEKGIVLYWFTKDGVNAFMTPASAETITNMLWDWLGSDEAKKFEITESSDRRIDMDGSQHKGYRLYNESWNRVDTKDDNSSYTLVAFAPAWCWYGK